MKKVLFLTVLGLVACKGKHLAWVTNEEKPKQQIEREKVSNIAGVQFTFDDGPDLAKTPKILDVLKKYNLQATFFIEGINLAGDSEQAQERRDLLRRINSEGHWIGNHTYDHKDLCRVPEQKAIWEIETTQKLIEETIGNNFVWPVTMIRPPYGKKCKQLNKILQRGYGGGNYLHPVYWQIDPREWERDPKTHQFKTAEQVIDGIMAQYYQLHNEQGIKNMIIILHDTKQVTVELLPKLLTRLAKEK